MGAVLTTANKVWEPLTAEESDAGQLPPVSNMIEHCSCALSDTLTLFVAASTGAGFVFTVFDFDARKWKKCVAHSASDELQLPTDLAILSGACVIQSYVRCSGSCGITRRYVTIRNA